MTCRVGHDWVTKHSTEQRSTWIMTRRNLVTVFATYSTGFFWPHGLISNQELNLYPLQCNHGVLTLIRTFPSQEIPFNSFLSMSIHRAIRVSVILKACVKFLPRGILIWITTFFVVFFGIQVGINHLHDKNTPHIKLSLWCKGPSKRGETTVAVWWKGFSILQWKIHHVP